MSLGQRVYLVGLFEHWAIADSEDYGNALYFCPADGDKWKAVFRLDKQHALAAGARRIVHTEGWQDRVRRLVAVLP